MQIRLENVAKRFGGVTALEELTLSIEPGEMMVLLGPSGCGKSTTLRLVAGLEEASSGDIHIGDRRVNDVPPQERDVAMVFQNYALYPHMTIGENIAYPLRVRKKSKEEIAKEVQRVAGKLGIDDLLGRTPRQLSGGQRQRVALARAIVRQPVAYLMDEPLSNLDAGLRLQMRAELKHLQRELGTTTLYVTHDHDEAMTLAHRITLLKDGRLQQVGTPLELYHQPCNRFVAGFLGTPPMNFLEGQVEEQAFRFEGGSIALSTEQVAAAATANGAEKLVLGFRPQEARLVEPGGSGLRAQVYVTEEMGSETVVFLTCGGQRVTVTAEADFRAATGEALGVMVPASALHLFNGETGKILVSGEGKE
jgi:multiple sugar transport system ATP-binding protein